MKVEPASLELKVKVGVGSLVKLPAAGPEAIVATGGVLSRVKLLKAAKAGFAVRLLRRRPAVPQMLHRRKAGEPAGGSRHRNQKRR